MGRYGGRGSRNGPRRTGRSTYGKTRRGGRRTTSGRSNLGRWGVGLGIAAGGALAVAGALHSYAGISHSVKTIAGDFKAARKWVKARKATKEVLSASTLKFHTSRVRHINILRGAGGKKPKMAKFRNGIKTKLVIRRHGKR